MEKKKVNEAMLILRETGVGREFRLSSVLDNSMVFFFYPKVPFHNCHAGSMFYLLYPRPSLLVILTGAPLGFPHLAAFRCDEPGLRGWPDE